MDEKFCTGILLGMLGGALITTYSQKTRTMVKDNAEKVKKKVSSMAKKKPNKPE